MSIAVLGVRRNGGQSSDIGYLLYVCCIGDMDGVGWAGGVAVGIICFLLPHFHSV